MVANFINIDSKTYLHVNDRPVGYYRINLLHVQLECNIGDTVKLKKFDFPIWEVVNYETGLSLKPIYDSVGNPISLESDCWMPVEQASQNVYTVTSRLINL